MCCTTTIGGMGGQRRITRASACGPPVEIPIAIRPSPEGVSAADERSGRLDRTRPRFAAVPEHPAFRGAEDLGDEQVARGPDLGELVLGGLGQVVDGAEFERRRVILAPSWVRALTMTTGTGWTARIAGRASSPETSGISTSRVTTSGLSWAVFNTASRPSRAVPTTSIPGVGQQVGEQPSHQGRVVDHQDAHGRRPVGASGSGIRLWFAV